MNPAGLLFDSSPHYIDHLAPLCSLLDWPLVFCDPSIGESLSRFYPELQLRRAPGPLGLGRWLTDRFSHIVSCSAQLLLKASIGPFFFRHFWLPHGNSDKGQIRPYFNALQDDSTLLIYGQKMADFFHAGGISLSRTIRIGAFRKLYWEKRSCEWSISFSHPNQTTLLYAPTWEDPEGNGSFWTAFSKLSAKLPSSINLIVKPHPNTILQDEPRLEQLIGRHSSNNLQFLLNYPPIYPLLERSSALLGDRSSIGYDFLHFNRPMLFLDPHDSPLGRDLLACGLSVQPHEVFQRHWNEDGERLSQKRQAMASYTFDDVPLESLRSCLYQTSMFCRAERGQDKKSLQIV